jgi:hypothetical protein
MGIVDISSLHRCGVRMNGVLIEWNPWLGYFYIFTFFTRTYMSHNTKTIFTKCCIPFYNSAVGIQLTWINWTE